MRTLVFLLLPACAFSIDASGLVTATSDTGDTGDTDDTDLSGDTGDTDDTDPTGETGETGDTDPSGDTGELPCTPRVVSTTLLGEVPDFPGTTGRAGGVSVLTSAGVSWFWFDAALETADADGTNYRGSIASSLSGSDPLDAGAWTSSTDEVLATQSGDTLPVYWGMWWSSPYGVRAAASRGSDALLFVKKTTADGDAGVALATWDGAGATLLPGEGTDPTVVFAAEDDFQPMAAAVSDGVHMYAWDCHITYAAFGCTLGRAELDEVGERDSWAFWTGTNWSWEASEAAEVFTGGPQMSVHWNDELDRYVATYGDWADTRVLWRTAENPEGPWSDAEVLFTTERVDADAWEFVWTAEAHPELAADGGRLEYVTYSFGSDTRLVEVELACEE